MGEICSVCFEESGLLLSSPVDGKMVCEDCLKRDKLGVPRDKYSSGNRDDLCFAKIYGLTQKEAETKAKRYYARYPVQGYSTHTRHSDWLDHLPGCKTRIFYIHVSRWHSCD